MHYCRELLSVGLCYRTLILDYENTYSDDALMALLCVQYSEVFYSNKEKEICFFRNVSKVQWTVCVYISRRHICTLHS